MSIKAMQWAWEQNIPSSSRKLVLLALADRANDDGECWPGIASLSEKCSIPRRTLIRALADLEAHGLLQVKHRQGASGRMTNLYRLPINQPVQKWQSAVKNEGAKCQRDTRQSAKIALGKVPKLQGQSAKNGGAKCQALAPNTKVNTKEEPKGYPKEGRARDALPVAPDWLSPEVWEAFIAHRKQKRKPLTAQAATITLRDLDKARSFGHDPERLIETAIAAGWTGCVFADKHFAFPGGGRNQAKASSPFASPLADEFGELMAIASRPVIEGVAING